MEEKNLNFDEIIDRKGTDCLKFDFAVRRGKPEGVLPLWVADMDFKTSSLVLDAINERVNHGIFGYSECGESYYAALNNWLIKHHGLSIKQEWIVKTPGVVFGLAMAVKAFTNEGDGVLIQQPVYYPFSEVIADNGRRVISNDLILNNGRYEIDFDDFESKIKEKNVKLFIFCNPHNPVGRVWTEAEIRTIGNICLRNNVIVISDEIHADFTYTGFKHISFTTVDKAFEDITIIATSPAKTFNLAGLQISNIIIPNEKLRNAVNKEIARAGYSQLNTLGLIACEAAYTYGGEWYEALMKYLEENLRYVREFLQDELPKVKLIEPEGTYLVWLDFNELGLESEELEDLIINKAHLWLDSGAIFGKAGSGFQRINIATNKEVLVKALTQLKAAVDNI